MLRHTYRESADNVNDQNQNAGNGIAFYEFTGTIHRTIKIGFGSNIRTPLLRLIGINQPCIQIRINRHLLAGHCVQSKAGTYFRYPACTFGNDHEINDHQNDEHHQTNGVITTDQHFTECLNYFPGSITPFMTIQQHHTGGSHVESET